MEKGQFVVPTIDLGKFGDSEIESPLKKLREACEEFGIFRIINHGISPTLMSDMKDVARSLFDRPIEIKRRNVDVIASSGYVGLSQDSPLFESLGLYGLGLAEAHRSFCDQLEATAHERDIIEKYSEAVNKLVVETRRKLTKSIGLSDVDLFKEWPWQMKINKYHFSPKTLGMTAARTHTDSGFFTILQDDGDVEGLEVISRSSGEFEAVHPRPGTFLLVIGDVAKAWSNGRFHNPAHKVRCKKGMSRISIVTFFFSPKDEAIEAPSELVDEEHPRLYAPFFYEDHRKLRLSKNMFAGETLELYRLSNASR